MSELILRKRGRRGSPESWSVDTHVGQRVRMRRTLLGMSQERLGEAIGLTFQQVQKYERGSNRISAGTLFRLGQVLDVPVSFFFDDYDDGQSPKSHPGASPAVNADGSIISRREARLLRLWRAAPSGVADEVLALLSSLSPHLRDPAEEGPAEEVPVDDGLRRERMAPAPEAAAPSHPSSDSKPLPSRKSGEGKPAKTSGDEEGKTRRPRRRHGAVWDPTDIYRSVKG